MSEIRAVESQGIASPIVGLTMIAVFCEAVDGWRCYESAHALDIDGDWDAQKAEAIAWTHAHGNKLSLHSKRGNTSASQPNWCSPDD